MYLVFSCANKHRSLCSSFKTFLNVRQYLLVSFHLMCMWIRWPQRNDSLVLQYVLCKTHTHTHVHSLSTSYSSLSFSRPDFFFRYIKIRSTCLFVKFSYLFGARVWIALKVINNICIDVWERRKESRKKHIRTIKKTKPNKLKELKIEIEIVYFLNDWE